MYDPTGRQDVTHAASRLPYAALGLWGRRMEIGQSRQSNQATRHGSAFTQRARLGHRVSGCLLPPVPHRTSRISQVPRRITESSESQREVCFSLPVEVLMKHSPRISVRESRAEERNVNSDGNLGWLDLVRLPPASRSKYSQPRLRIAQRNDEVNPRGLPIPRVSYAARKRVRAVVN